MIHSLNSSNKNSAPTTRLYFKKHVGQDVKVFVENVEQKWSGTTGRAQNKYLFQKSNSNPRPVANEEIHSICLVTNRLKGISEPDAWGLGSTAS